jgi:GNAT superfamily N-acetyltransferase
MDVATLPALLTITPIRADDAPGLGRLLERCSPQTTYNRYFTPIRRPRPGALRNQIDVDHHRREAIVVRCADEVTGIGQYETLDARADVAEIAVLVEDAWQGRGLGAALLTRIGELAASRGITRLTATVLSSNVAVIALLQRLFPRVDVRPQGYTCDVEIALTD